ncbi:ferredoxin [Candidatus Bathyarchaeota archaeon]|nr:MAG: ferredoxin [Candidatus Bathyarchaeota archaeon]
MNLSAEESKLIREIKINYDACLRCGECVKSCVFSVLEFLDEQPVVVNPKKCSGCMECVRRCPSNAIAVSEK